MAVILAFAVLYDGVPIFLSRVLRVGVTTKQRHRDVVFLTFDDGPDPNYTPRLLDELKRIGLQATFFVVAEKALRHSHIIERMVAEGHQIELHGYTHACLPLLMPRAAARQVLQAHETLVSTFGLKPSWYRPTWGLMNAAAWGTVLYKRLRFITWSIMVGDWRQTPPQTLCERIVHKLHPGAIIVLHDSDETFGADTGAPNNVIAMLPDLALAVKRRGFSFELLDESK